MNDLINTAKNPHTWRQRLLEYYLTIRARSSSLESSVSDMISITTKTNSEIESVSIKVRQSASAKAEQIVAAAKAKAEQESDEISKNGQIKLEEIRARIKSESASAVEYVVYTVLKPA